VRKRTQAKQRSDARPKAEQAPPMPQGAVTDARQVVELVRSSSKITKPTMQMPSGPGQQLGHGRNPSLPPQGAAPQQQHPGQQGRHPSHANSMPGGEGAQPGRPFAHAQRYSLADPGSSPKTSAAPLPGSSSSAPPGQGGRTQTPGGRTPGGRIASGAGGPQSPPSHAASPAPSSQSSVKYQTFAEMGIQSGKVEDKECVIM
jgi:hypothetical protein